MKAEIVKNYSDRLDREYLIKTFAYGTGTNGVAGHTACSRSPFPPTNNNNGRNIVELGMVFAGVLIFARHSLNL